MFNKVHKITERQHKRECKSEINRKSTKSSPGDKKYEQSDPKNGG